MKLIKPSYEILSKLDGKILEAVESAARTCYKSEEKIGSHEECPKCKKNPIDDCNVCGGIGTTVSSRALVYKLMERGHEAMLEFGPSITVKFVCDRGVSHELVRHRLASFAQESTRYCNYAKGGHISFIIPCWIDDIEEGEYPTRFVEKNGRAHLECDAFDDDRTDPNSTWFWKMANDEITYNDLSGNGWSPQEARSVLPNSLKTEINVKANIREWRHIFKQRVANAAHPQMREIMRPLLDEFKAKIPILFDDINY